MRPVKWIIDNLDDETLHHLRGAVIRSHSASFTVRAQSGRMYAFSIRPALRQEHSCTVALDEDHSYYITGEMQEIFSVGIIWMVKTETEICEKNGETV